MSSALERFDLGGPPQWALVRGRGPVLLMVQAGPGIPMIHDADALERSLALEERFRVVYWDQRGTGKSFDPRDAGAIPRETLVADVRAMARALCERFDVPAVDIVGFSAGATFALLACDGEGVPVRSLTCVGPDVDLLESERSALRFALEEAGRRGHRRALASLRSIGEPPHTDMNQFMTRLRWVANFGGVHRDKDFGALLRTTVARLWASPHYSLGEMIGALRAIGKTQARVLPGLQGLDLLASPMRIEPPVAVFQGRRDAAAPAELGARLAEHLGARLVWFDESAHMPYEEEPARFRDELLRFTSAASLAP